ncbi:MAG: hypothetical protein Q8K11_00590 [Phenylobacterium sp.]|uniref:hypothetical protein n=1 Tax=Phenylobacterium sp. TaxID=1871053 RepID=UPI00272F67E8|nr:hypothetical protein [Phenylobacterium sp.]MDP2008651.1 hypothetical protein [Phenylobacterium sp.]
MGHQLRMGRSKRAVLLLLIVGGVLASCASVWNAHLSSHELKACIQGGGYESRGPFGYPICQHRYADGGKTCSSRSDCAGRCLADAPEDWRSRSLGTLAAGRCEAESSTFGCYALVEDGKLATPYTCYD